MAAVRRPVSVKTNIKNFKKTRRALVYKTVLIAFVPSAVRISRLLPLCIAVKYRNVGIASFVKEDLSNDFLEKSRHTGCL